jgi:AcrR family transcriptional regulator
MRAASARPAPKVRQRRKEARPGEIVQIALECFLEAGFEATKLDEIARRGGFAKGTIYVYFQTKEDLFRAVVKEVMDKNLAGLATTAAFDGPFEEMLPAFLAELVETVLASRAPAMLKLILREADRFPDLARIWFEHAVLPVIRSLESAVAQAQKRGELRKGEPRLHVFSILGPISYGLLFREVLQPLGIGAIHLPDLAAQHASVILHGLRSQAPASGPRSRKRGPRKKFRKNND